MNEVYSITLNIYAFLGVIVFSARLGFIGRSRQLARKQRRIAKLETDMVDSDAELLAVQRANVLLEARIKEFTNPVISMKGTKLEEKSRSAGTS